MWPIVFTIRLRVRASLGDGRASPLRGVRDEPPPEVRFSDPRFRVSLGRTDGRELRVAATYRRRDGRQRASGRLSLPLSLVRSLSPRNKPLEGGGPPRRERRTGAEQGSHVQHCGYLAPFYELTHGLTTLVRAPAARTAAAACRSSAH